jgi:hypothetical protein
VVCSKISSSFRSMRCSASLSAWWEHTQQSNHIADRYDKFLRPHIQSHLGVSTSSFRFLLMSSAIDKDPLRIPVYCKTHLTFKPVAILLIIHQSAFQPPCWSNLRLLYRRFQLVLACGDSFYRIDFVIHVV